MTSNHNAMKNTNNKVASHNPPPPPGQALSHSRAWALNWNGSGLLVKPVSKEASDSKK